MITLKKGTMWAPRFFEPSYYKHKWPFIKRTHSVTVENFSIAFEDTGNDHVSVKIPGLMEIPHPFQTNRLNHENGSYLNFAHENSLRLIATYVSSSDSVVISPYLYANGNGPAFGHLFNRDSFLKINNGAMIDKYTLSIDESTYQFSFDAWIDEKHVVSKTKSLPPSYKCSYFCTPSWIHARGYHGPNSPCDIQITID